MNPAPPFFSDTPVRRIDRWTALGLAVAFGLLLVLLGDAKVLYQLAFWAGIFGVAVLLFLPQPRMVLVLAWVLLFPLNLEKIEVIGPSTYPHIIPPILAISATDLILLVLLGLILFEALWTGRPILRYWPRAGWPFLALWAWIAFDFLIHTPSIGSAFQILHWSKMLAYLFVLTAAIRTRSEVIVVLAATAVAVLIQSFIVGLSYATHIEFGLTGISSALVTFSGGDTSYHRATGTLGYVNGQAQYQTFFMLPLVGLLFARNLFWRGLAALTGAASLMAIVLTFTRGAWLSCAAAFAVIIFVAMIKGRMGKKSWLLLTAFAVVAVMVLAAFSGPIGDRLTTKGDEGATVSRLRMIQMAMQHIYLHPVAGVGPGNFISARIEQVPLDWHGTVWLQPGEPFPFRQVASFEYGNTELRGETYLLPMPVHNKYLLVASELGLVGLALFLWYFWRVMGHARGCLRTRDSLMWWTGLGLMASVCAGFVYQMFDLIYGDGFILILFPQFLAMTCDRLAGEERMARQVAVGREVSPQPA
jgi:hypothetical protein